MDILAYEVVEKGMCRYGEADIGIFRSTVVELGDLDRGQIGMTRRVSWRVAVLY